MMENQLWCLTISFWEFDKKKNVSVDNNFLMWAEKIKGLGSDFGLDFVKNVPSFAAFIAVRVSSGFLLCCPNISLVSAPVEILLCL